MKRPTSDQYEQLIKVSGDMRDPFALKGLAILVEGEALTHRVAQMLLGQRWVDNRAYLIPDGQMADWMALGTTVILWKTLQDRMGYDSFDDFLFGGSLFAIPPPPPERCIAWGGMKVPRVLIDWDAVRELDLLNLACLTHIEIETDLEARLVDFTSDRTGKEWIYVRDNWRRFSKQDFDRRPGGVDRGWGFVEAIFTALQVPQIFSDERACRFYITEPEVGFDGRAVVIERCSSDEERDSPCFRIFLHHYDSGNIPNIAYPTRSL
jgi:hypothetical protein